MLKRYVMLFVALLVIMPLAQAAQRSVVTDLSQMEFQNLLAEADGNETVIIDVRTPKEFSEGRVPGAINIPHAAILQNPSLVSAYRDKKLVFYCHSGRRAGFVTELLSQTNVDGLYHLQGDYRAWRGNFQPIEK